MATDLKFGTSGLRGLVSELDGPPAESWTRAFLALLEKRGAIRPGDGVPVGYDLRASSPAIAARVHGAIRAAGFDALDCGAVPTPALALAAMERGVPAIMVTGSHIPEDRNGLKFYRADGEIDKRDEEGIVAIHDGPPPPDAPRPGALRSLTDILARYSARYLDFFGGEALKGLRVGVYQHSSVARDLIVDVLRALGAEAVALGRAQSFIPVDTEALRPEDVELLHRFAGEQPLDAIVSTDGDADRPLIADEAGRFVRGDLVGAMTAARLGADAVVTPVTSNSALETCGRFGAVVRTRVGSPYVIEGMAAAVGSGARRVAGFEANGGVLLASPVEEEGRRLAALPTRDAMLPIVCILSEIARRAEPLSRLAAGFGFRATASDRLREVPARASGPFLDRLEHDEAYRRELLAALGPVAGVDARDGVRILAADGRTVHFRVSGNAPEVRCYVEAPDAAQAEALLGWGLAVAKAEIDKAGA